MLRFLRGASKRTKTIWWVLIFVTVVTFLGGFVFLLGAGLDSSYRARASGAAGTVNGQAISRTDFQNALDDQRASYKRQYGSDPGDRDLKVVEVQAWRSLVAQRLMTEQARALGLSAHDREVVLTLQTSPPAALASAPVFQTNGKFDASKYQAALRDPNNNWGPFEDLIRRQLPMRKLQERLLSSVKLSEPELKQAFRDRFERVSATLIQIPPDNPANPPSPSEAEMDRAYQKHKSRFVAGPRAQLEVLLVPKKYGAEELRAARELAQSLVNRARKGEDFASLARDYSEGPGADKGGVIDRVLQLSDFGTELAPKIAALDTGGVSDPLQERGRFIIFKVLEKAPAAPGGMPGYKVAQVVIKVRPNDTAMRDQFDEMVKISKQAARGGLGKAAAAKGLATATTAFYDLNNPPTELYEAPEAADWGLVAKQGEVSPVFDGIDDYVVIQVAAQSPGGPLPRQEVTAQLRQLAQLEAAVERSRPKADAISKAMAGGQTLEQPAQGAGLTPVTVAGMSRAQPDPHLNGAPEVVGALFAAHPGQVMGPVRAVNGWYFARLDQSTPADSAMFEQVRGQISSDLLQRRQQSVFNNYLNQLRAKAKIKYLRYDQGS